MSMFRELDEAYAPQILEIFNHAIVHTTALYDYRPRPLSAMSSWFAAKRAGSYPVFGIVDLVNPDVLKGFASYGPFRDRPANKYSIEHSVYVHPDHQGQGLGKLLLAEVIRRAQENGFHTLIGGIDAENLASIRLHQQAGFQRVGVLPETAFKFGRWLTLEFHQLILTGPVNPREE